MSRKTSNVRANDSERNELDVCHRILSDLDFQQHRMSALIHVREKLMNRKHNVIVFNALQTLFHLTAYLAMPRVFGSSLLVGISRPFHRSPSSQNHRSASVCLVETRPHRIRSNFLVDRSSSACLAVRESDERWC